MNGSSSANHPLIAIGPKMPGIGSWDWVGRDLIDAIKVDYDVRTWSESIPRCDVLIIVKYGFSDEVLAAARDAAVVYFPIDAYGSASDLDLQGRCLTQCSRIVVHSHTLAHYFISYARVEYLDHAIRYVSPMPDRPRPDGAILFVGMLSNIAPLAEWMHSHTLPGPLLVLTNLDDSELSFSIL